MAATRESETYWHLSKAHSTRRGGQLVLRGRKLWKGALCLFHNGRAMPAASFDNALTVLNGGPLNVAGADANGGLRFFARVPNVKLQIGAGSLQCNAFYDAATGTWLVTILFAAMTNTAIETANAVRAHAMVNQLLAVGYTGTGVSAPGTQAEIAVPFVSVAGICKRTIDNSSDTSNDLDVTNTNFGPLEFDLGSPYLIGASSGAPAASHVGGLVSVVDDWTLSTWRHPLQIALPLADYSPERGPAVNLLAQPL